MWKECSWAKYAISRFFRRNMKIVSSYFIREMWKLGARRFIFEISKNVKSLHWQIVSFEFSKYVKVCSRSTILHIALKLSCWLYFVYVLFFFVQSLIIVSQTFDNPRQFGFIPGMGTEHAIANLDYLVRSYRANGFKYMVAIIWFAFSCNIWVNIWYIYGCNIWYIYGCNIWYIYGCDI